MEFFKVSSSPQVFIRALDGQLSENGLKQKWFWKLEEGHTSELDAYHNYEFGTHSEFRKQGLGWRPENFWLIHESYTGYWNLFTTSAEFFFRNGYFWNIWNFTRFCSWTMPYGCIKMLHFHLGKGGVSIKMQTYANRREGGLCQYQRSNLNFLI